MDEPEQCIELRPSLDGTGYAVLERGRIRVFHGPKLRPEVIVALKAVVECFGTRSPNAHVEVHKHELQVLVDVVEIDVALRADEQRCLDMLQRVDGVACIELGVFTGASPNLDPTDATKLRRASYMRKSSHNPV